MLRTFVAIILLLSLATNALAVGCELHDAVHAVFQHDDCCCSDKETPSDADRQNGKHSTGTPHQCCPLHQHHPTTIPACNQQLSPHFAERSFNATIPQLYPSDHLQELFKPPRHTI